MFNYDENASNAAKVLDKYNFKEDIDICKQNNTMSDYNLYDHIVDKYPKEVEDALDNLTYDEFRDYMTIRYGVQWRETISYSMYK